MLTDRATVPEAPLPGDVAVCAGCGGRAIKVSRNMNKKCSFCGSFKVRRNPVRPQVCRTCERRYCKYIPGGQQTCKHKITKPTPVSKTRLARAGKGLGHVCGECTFLPTIADLTAAFHGRETQACIGKKEHSLACNKFLEAPPSLLPIYGGALAQCKKDVGGNIRVKNKPITLLYVSPSTAEWMKSQATAINQKHGGNVGLATISRAVLNGMCEAKMDLGSCRGELDIQDLVRKMATANATEVDG